MKPEAFLKEVREYIARDELEQALQQLQQFMANSPQLDEVIHQSGRFAAIRKQIRMGTLSHADATLTQNQIRDALLGLLREIDTQQAQSPALGAEAAQAISIMQSKNVVADSTIIGQNVSIGDRQEIHHHYGDKKIPRNLSNPPFDPPVFLGREEELKAVHARLFAGENFLMLVNGQGGIGKTSFAARYWKNYQHEYQHRGFFFVGNGIENALLGIAPLLGVDFPDTMPGRERLKQLLQHIAELERPCLIVLDNANDAEELDAHYNLLRSCSNCHLLITSRLAALRESPVHPIGALPDELALQLFQRHYPQHRAEDDALFFSILRAVGSNTLVVELLAKNLRAMNSNELFYPLETLLADLQEKGLLRLREQASIQVDWQQFEKSTPEQIVSAMYDLRPLAPEALALLSAFAVLPAEDISYELLKTLLAPAEARIFSQQLDELHQTGWIEKNDINGRPHYKCSPVVQEIVRKKNPQLLADCNILIQTLITGLNEDNRHTNNYQQATVFARLGTSVAQALPADDAVATLCQNIGNYHKDTGDLNSMMQAYQKMLGILSALCVAEPDNANLKNGLAISCQFLGNTHSALGNLPQALAFFEQFNQLEKELHEAYPANVSFKNGLAISYQHLGNTHSALGNLPQALAFFEQDIELSKELHEAYPANVDFKNGLAISYAKLGETHTALGNLPQALKFFEQYNQREKELHDAYPQNVDFKNGLAISYSKLGETHTALGNLPQALKFFEERSRLGKELHDAYPQNVSFKHGLAISYSQLGETHSTLGNLPQALAFFEGRSRLGKELHEAYPANVSFKNGLAMSYEKLGDTHKVLGNLPQALAFFEQRSRLGKELHEAYPANVSFKNGLAISYEKLGDTHSALGNFPQALAFFEKRSRLGKELHEDYPANVSFKNGLATSYLLLGQFHRDQLKDRVKARLYIQKGYALYEALVRDFPDYQAFKGNYEWAKSALSDLEE